MSRRRNSAFTLAELVVVVVLLALLVGVLVPALGEVRARGGQATCLANLRAIGAATQSYANDDSHELLLPIHQMMVSNTGEYASVLGKWSWRMANWYAWGGATASMSFRTGTANPQPLGQFSTHKYAATTRPLTMYLYPYLKEVIHPTQPEYVFDLPVFRCPDDRGYPDNPDIDDSPAENANRPCYATLGNSYRASMSGLFLASESSYSGAFAVGAWGQRRSDLTNGSRLVLLGDPLFFNMTGRDDGSGGGTVDLTGWHGEFLKDNLLFVDGTARLTEASEMSPVPPGGFPPVDSSYASSPSRGDTFQLDCYPTPGAYIWGSARPSTLGDLGWPYHNYKDNLSGG